MKNYILDNNTIALKKVGTKTVIYKESEVKEFKTNIKMVIDFNCNYYGSSWEGRKKCAQNILKIKYRVPIIIDIYHNIILLQLNSIRNKECLFLVANKIIDYEEKEGKLKITCYHNNVFYTSLSKSSLEKMLLQSFKLANTLKSRKNTNFV